MRILLVEDEKHIAEPLIKVLERRAYAVDHAINGKKGYELASHNEYDCIILDLNLPEMDGIKIAKNLRSNNIATPILMLTARTRQEEVWEGFETGADDYLVKPFDLKELLLRINALIKRNSKIKDEILKINSLTVDTNSFEVKKEGKVIPLNNKEFGILEYLLRNRDRVVSAEELLEHVWDREIDIFTQTIRTNIKTLRKKIDPDKKLIQTVIGKGYVIR